MSLLQVSGLKKHYPIRKLLQPSMSVKAVDGVSFNLEAKQTLALVGESGCGKSTLAKALMGLETPTAGKIKIEGRNFNEYKRSEIYQKVQMIFQDPYSSINPRKKAWQIIAEPLFINTKNSRKDCKLIAQSLMERVGLRPELADRYPHMFSGGQRQRIGIARALVLKPKVLICDEPVSALDVSVQAQVINLLIELQDELDLSYLFISHDLSVVKHLCDQVLVMYLGKIVEYGTYQQIFEKAQHPYTQALLASSPKISSTGPQKGKSIQGELPSPLNPPSGCAFHKRCPHADEQCKLQTPDLFDRSGHLAACLKLDEIAKKYL